MSVVRTRSSVRMVEWYPTPFVTVPGYYFLMPDTSLLEVFPSPTDTPFLVEHVNEEFTSVCPKTGHPDFGTVTVRFEPDKTCVELKSLKLYYHSFRGEGIFYEAVTNRICEDLVEVMSPRWLQVVTDWRGRGGIRSRITACYGDVPNSCVDH
jgi:7-cyano-7-deazaguanine reductase